MGNVCNQGENTGQYNSPNIQKSIQNSKPFDGQFPFQKISQNVFSKLEQLNIDSNVIKNASVRQFKPNNQYQGFLIHNLNLDKNIDQQKNQIKPQGLFKIKPSQKIILCLKKQNNKKTIINHQSVNKNDQESQKYLQQERKNNNQQVFSFQKIYYGQINNNGLSKGLLFQQNGQIFDGSLNLNKIQYQGQGILKNYDNTHIFNGTFENGLPHGQGQQIYNNYEFKGIFVNGVRQGKGKIRFLPSKNNPAIYQYQGQFKNGQLVGDVKIKQNGNQVYKGQLVNDKQEGQGEWKNTQNQNELSYKGSFVSGKKQGNGIYNFNSQTKFEGQFKDGKPQGHGILYLKNKMIQGLWMNGKNAAVYYQRDLIDVNKF